MKNCNYQEERERLTELFKEVEPAKAKLAEGLIEEAAFLRVQNQALRETLVETGMVKIHPQHLLIQKPVETARQYLKNVNSYSVIVKTLNSILQKNFLAEEDEFDAFLKERDRG
jgi:regulator of replication initiation timing